MKKEMNRPWNALIRDEEDGVISLNILLCLLSVSARSIWPFPHLLMEGYVGLV